MGRKVTLIGADQRVEYEVIYKDAAMVKTAVGEVVATSLLGCDKASYQINGPIEDGNVNYTSVYGGSVSNLISIRHYKGSTGGAYANRALTISVGGLSVAVLYGTDGNGDSVTPTATQVVDAVAAHQEASSLVVAVAGGDGSGSVGEFPQVNLSAGCNNGHSLKFLGNPNVCRYLNLVETV
jgi:hypothetical protein